MALPSRQAVVQCIPDGSSRTRPSRTSEPQVRAHRPAELVRHRRERSELGVGALDERGKAQLSRLLDGRGGDAAGVLDEGDGVRKEAFDLGTFHHVVVSGQEPFRSESGEGSRGAEVALDVEVRRGADHVAVHVEQAAPQHGVHDDGSAGRRIPEAHVPRGMTRQVEHFHHEVGAEADVLATTQADVHGAIGPHRLREPREDVGGIAESVGLVPAVPLAQDRLGALDPGHVQLVCQEQGVRGSGTDRRVATEVIDVRVGVQDDVRLPALQEREDHVGGRVRDAGVDQKRALPQNQVLRERAGPEDALDAVDTGCNFHDDQAAPTGRIPIQPRG